MIDAGRFGVARAVQGAEKHLAVQDEGDALVVGREIELAYTALHGADGLGGGGHGLVHRDVDNCGLGAWRPSPDLEVVLEDNGTLAARLIRPKDTRVVEVCHLYGFAAAKRFVEKVFVAVLLIEVRNKVDAGYPQAYRLPVPS